jgi:hypothetical protein
MQANKSVKTVEDTSRATLALPRSAAPIAAVPGTAVPVGLDANLERGGGVSDAPWTKLRNGGSEPALDADWLAAIDAATD